MGVTIEEFDLRTTFKLDRRLLLFAGFYPRRTSKHKFLYIFGATINIFFSAAQLVSMGVQMIIDKNDVSMLSESLQYFTTVNTFVLKLICFVINKKHLLEIEDILTFSCFYGHSEHHVKLLKQKIRVGEVAGKVFRLSCVAAVSFWGLPPFFDNEKSKSLPVPGWFPYDVKNYYYPTFAFQILGIANTAYTNSSLDILTWILISVACGQLEILKENLKSIDYKSEASEEILCILHHQQIIRLVHKIEIMCSVGVFLQIFASVIVICFTGFLLIILPIFTMQFALTFTYFVCMMCQVAMYCWFGQDVMSTSSTIGESFYMSNWYKSNLRIRKSIFILMETTKRPIKLSAGFVTLSLTTLTTILRSSYSYFAVLNRMYNP